MQDYETNHNSARALDVGRSHLPAGNGVGGRKLNVRRLDIGADFPRSLPEQLENMVHALTAKTMFSSCSGRDRGKSAPMSNLRTFSFRPPTPFPAGRCERPTSKARAELWLVS